MLKTAIIAELVEKGLDTRFPFKDLDEKGFFLAVKQQPNSLLTTEPVVSHPTQEKEEVQSAPPTEPALEPLLETQEVISEPEVTVDPSLSIEADELVIDEPTVVEQPVEVVPAVKPSKATKVKSKSSK